MAGADRGLIPGPHEGQARVDFVNARLREIGQPVDEWVEAASQWPPHGFGSWSLMFTRYWLITRHDRDIWVWHAFTGPSPTTVALRTTTDDLMRLKTRSRWSHPAGWQAVLDSQGRRPRH